MCLVVFDATGSLVLQVISTSKRVKQDVLVIIELYHRVRLFTARFLRPQQHHVTYRDPLTPLMHLHINPDQVHPLTT